jgi:hypothetical protein
MSKVLTQGSGEVLRGGSTVKLQVPCASSLVRLLYMEYMCEHDMLTVKSNFEWAIVVVRDVRRSFSLPQQSLCCNNVSISLGALMFYPNSFCYKHCHDTIAVSYARPRLHLL